MAEKYLELLKDEKTRFEIALLILDYTRRYLAVRHGWHDKSMLPGGQDPEGIVYTLFEKILLGRRPLSGAEDLVVQLKGMIKSEVSNLFSSSDGKCVSFEPAGDEGPNHEPIAPSDDSVQSNDACKRVFDLLEEHPSVKSDEDFGYVILAYQEGASSAKAVSEKTGIKVERVYEYNRKLKKIYPAIKAKLSV